MEIAANKKRESEMQACLEINKRISYGINILKEMKCNTGGSNQ